MLGDRYEILVTTVSTLVSGIPLLIYMVEKRLPPALFDDAIRQCDNEAVRFPFLSRQMSIKRVLQMRILKQFFLLAG